MKSLKSIKSDLFKKEITGRKMQSITGGYTLTGCAGSLASKGDEYECSDTDQDSRIEMSIV